MTKRKVTALVGMTNKNNTCLGRDDKIIIYETDKTINLRNLPNLLFIDAGWQKQKRRDRNLEAWLEIQLFDRPA